jgi:hypothetical protein
MPNENEIDYHSRPLEFPEKVTWHQGEAIMFCDGRSVAVFRSPAGPGLFFKIVSPIEDGKKSVLKFRLSDEASCALAVLIQAKFTPIAPNKFIPKE